MGGQWRLFSIVLFFVVFWLLPGLTQYIWPAASEAFFSKVQQCLPPLLALFLMNFIKVDGSPIFEWKDAVGSVNWNILLFMASIMGLGAFMGNADLGITTWLSSIFSPIFANVSPTIFILVILLAVVWYGALNGPLAWANNQVWNLLVDGTGWVDQLAYASYLSGIGTRV